MTKKELLGLASKYGTPLYVYDEAVIRRQCQKLRIAFPNAAIHYAVKANSNPLLGTIDL
jgi:diaminopimelate decarboxylase